MDILVCFGSNMDINTDPSCNRTMDLDMAIGSSLSQDITMASNGCPGSSYLLFSTTVQYPGPTFSKVYEPLGFPSRLIFPLFTPAFPISPSQIHTSIVAPMVSTWKVFFVLPGPALLWCVCESLSCSYLGQEWPYYGLFFSFYTSMFMQPTSYWSTDSFIFMYFLPKSN